MTSKADVTWKPTGKELGLFNAEMTMLRLTLVRGNGKTLWQIFCVMMSEGSKFKLTIF